MTQKIYSFIRLFLKHILCFTILLPLHLLCIIAVFILTPILICIFMFLDDSFEEFKNDLYDIYIDFPKTFLIKIIKGDLSDMF